MDNKSWIQMGSLLVALITLFVQQTRVLKETRSKERRVETKLRIFYILTESDKKEEDILVAFDKQANVSEIRKSLYEMLADETIYYQQNRTYRAHWRHLKT